ncbi:VWA domain-containing protein [Pseudonocardia spinosispora]|uniref:VWA domain-containing protein n=1 Tax=Pseudonocardia spinosispora TaxID=103441 RepID=UPI0004232A42|nr:VWA domain-containing protein [Pseudonocardia spinosispora]
MSFTDPWWLLLLVVVAGLVVAYWLMQKRRQRDVLKFSNLETLEKVAPARNRWLRHGPTALMLVALVLLTIASAGPTAEAQVPRNRATVILVIDISESMRATDVAPSRLLAAQTAAKAFADQLTPGINLGLISFAGTAAVLVSPTVDRAPVKRAIDGLHTAESTATGEAIFAGLQSIDSFSQALSGGGEGPPPARIVLMSDGKQTVPGPDGENEPRGSFTAARKAAEKKISVSTISFGTLFGIVDIKGQRIPVPVDDASLRQVAQLSGGQFFTAASQQELQQVYATLGQQIGYETKQVDISGRWLVAGTLLAMLGLAGAFALGRRLP